MRSLPLPQTQDSKQGDSVLVKQDRSYPPSWIVQAILDRRLLDNLALLRLSIYLVLSYNSLGNFI